MKNITIIDYGMGNIKSLYNALKFIGYNPIFYSENKKIKTTICIVPGVGAFNQAMKLIKEKNILDDLNNLAKREGNLLIGIRLDMQRFFEESSENYVTSG